MPSTTTTYSGKPIQAFTFDRTSWTPAQARAWLKKHAHQIHSIDESDSSLWIYHVLPKSASKGRQTRVEQVFGMPGLRMIVIQPHEGHKKAAKKTTRKKTTRTRSDAIRGHKHALGKAKLAWQRWEADGPSRALRYGIGLNGENKGASVIVLEIRKHVDGWAYEVWPKNDYADLLPAKYQNRIEGIAKSKAAAKAEAEKLVGLKPERKKTTRKKTTTKKAAAKKTTRKKTTTKKAAAKKTTRKKTATKKVAGKKAVSKKASSKTAHHGGHKKASSKTGSKKASSRTHKHSIAMLTEGRLIGILDKPGGKVVQWGHFKARNGDVVTYRANGSSHTVHGSRVLVPSAR